MIINQPYSEQLGIKLIETIESNLYTQLTIMVAYAKLSGVYRILPYLEKFHKNGGIIRCVVGIDQQNTTYDALLQLLKIADEISVFHSESISQTFHIKCYWFSGNNECWYAIGSNNLTSGGLFSNYELSSSSKLSGNEALKINNILESIYSTYTDVESVCCHKLDLEFLDKLISDGYVVKEIRQRKVFVEASKQERSTVRKNKLFGNEVFMAPALPTQYRKNNLTKSKIESENVQKKTIQVNTSAVNQSEGIYLIRLVPKAGDRSSQVHFTIDLLKQYFRLSPGDGILVQEMFPSGDVGEIEHRQIVFSKRNHNVKIELSGASMLDISYPEDTETRPVLILKRVNDNLFVYMILLDGDEGYSAINARLKALPPSRSLPYEVIDESTMFSLWDNCPIM